MCFNVDVPMPLGKSRITACHSTCTYIQLLNDLKTDTNDCHSHVRADSAESDYLDHQRFRTCTLSRTHT